MSEQPFGAVSPSSSQSAHTPSFAALKRYHSAGNKRLSYNSIDVKPFKRVEDGGVIVSSCEVVGGCVSDQYIRMILMGR